MEGEVEAAGIHIVLTGVDSAAEPCHEGNSVSQTYWTDPGRKREEKVTMGKTLTCFLRMGLVVLLLIFLKGQNIPSPSMMAPFFPLACFIVHRLLSAQSLQERQL